jgi:hypothetical protein
MNASASRQAAAECHLVLSLKSDLAAVAVPKCRYQTDELFCIVVSILILTFVARADTWTLAISNMLT